MTSLDRNSDPQHHMRLCGNEAPLIWLAEKCGYDWATIRKHASGQERRVAELEREVGDLRRLLRLKAEVEAGR